MKFGNKDTAQKHDLSKIPAIEKGLADDKVIVRHYNTVSYANGTQVEDPTTSRIQVYDKATYENMTRQPIDKDGKQQKSQFQEAGLNVDVLHYPGEQPEKSADVKRKAADVIADINEAKSAAEVDALLIEGEDRKTVLDAASVKKATF